MTRLSLIHILHPATGIVPADQRHQGAAGRHDPVAQGRRHAVSVAGGAGALSLIHIFHTAIESVDRAAFDQVVDRLLTASHIYLMGGRSSAFLAGYLHFYLHLMFKTVTLVQNAAAGEIFEQLSQIGPGDVLVGISFPRYSQMAIHAAVSYTHLPSADAP